MPVISIETDAALQDHLSTLLDEAYPGQTVQGLIQLRESLQPDELFRTALVGLPAVFTITADVYGTIQAIAAVLRYIRLAYTSPGLNPGPTRLKWKMREGPGWREEQIDLTTSSDEVVIALLTRGMIAKGSDSPES